MIILQGLVWGQMNGEFQDLSIDNVLELNGAGNGLERILLIPSINQ